MKTLRYDQPDFARAVAEACAASSLFDPQIEERVRGVIDDVRARGDEALVELTERFDKVRLKPSELRVTAKPVRPEAKLLRAIGAAHRNVAAFAKRSLRQDWSMRNSQGGIVGEKFDPLQRVGIYVPGGTAPLVSTVLMTVTLAKVAGCPEIVVCSPPPIHPALLYAARAAGATEVYQLGGAQAVAAMALGTQSIRRVVKIFGPGNAYVTAAKKLLFGHVGIDLLSGPSELLVVADDTAKADFIAADLLAQAEHGSTYERVWLVTTSERVLAATAIEIQKQIDGLPRRDFAQRALQNGCVFVLAKDMNQAIAITNQFAPEHCEILVKNPQAAVKKIKTAGAIFVGSWSPTVVGDYLAGPSHELPTGGAGATFAGLTVDQFQRRTSVVELSRGALEKSLPALESFGTVEGLDAHVASARIRFP
ncbi:MAG TPA: histidinol dehydrogenase [Verrucomicrobiae bacterium]|nr:histidinol dehydrogenase [Verrucomicrobiae bacterium]